MFAPQLMDENVDECELFCCFHFIVHKTDKMFMGSTGRLPEYNSLNDTLVLDDNLEADEDRETDDSSEIIYMASFDELARNYLQYETIIWLSISLLLVLAWGIGVIMLLYLPFKRYVLMKDISSRKLYVTPTEIVYKVYLL